MYSLQNQNWYGNWYYPTPKPEDTEEEATTKPNYNQNQFVIFTYRVIQQVLANNFILYQKSVLDQKSILNQKSILDQKSFSDQKSIIDQKFILNQKLIFAHFASEKPIGSSYTYIAYPLEKKTVFITGRMSIL